jgi:hypothetical protein
MVFFAEANFEKEKNARRFLLGKIQKGKNPALIKETGFITMICITGEVSSN